MNTCRMKNDYANRKQKWQFLLIFYSVRKIEE